MSVDQSSPKAAWSATDLAEDPHVRRDKADRVRSMFASIAHAYDLNNRVHSFGLDRRWRAVAVQMASPTTSDRVLDVACGTGDLSEAFALAGVAEVIGVDFTEPMLEIARTKSSRLPSSVRSPEYRRGDAMALEVADESFDIVSIAFGIRNVSDPSVALLEFRRVLKPGGRLVILEFTQPRSRLLAFGHDLYMRRVMPLTAALLARDRSGAYRYLPRSVETFPDHRGLADMVRAAGFEITRQRVLTLGICAVTAAVRPLEG